MPVLTQQTDTVCAALACWTIRVGIGAVLTLELGKSDCTVDVVAKVIFLLCRESRMLKSSFDWGGLYTSLGICWIDTCLFDTINS